MQEKDEHESASKPKAKSSCFGGIFGCFNKAPKKKDNQPDAKYAVPESPKKSETNAGFTDIVR